MVLISPEMPGVSNIAFSPGRLDNKSLEVLGLWEPYKLIVGI